MNTTVLTAEEESIDKSNYQLPKVLDNLVVNPAVNMGTTNPALSLPYLKYYTSFMEEYAVLRDENDASDRKENGYEYPKYLAFKPYYSMSPFPNMLVYESADKLIKRQKKEVNKNKGTSTKDADPLYTDLDINSNPSKSSNIIFTYKVTNISSPLLKDKTITDLFDIQGGNLVKDLIVGLARNSDFGSVPTNSSQVSKYVYSIYNDAITKIKDPVTSGALASLPAKKIDDFYVLSLFAGYLGIKDIIPLISLLNIETNWEITEKWGKTNIVNINIHKLMIYIHPDTEYHGSAMLKFINENVKPEFRERAKTKIQYVISGKWNTAITDKNDGLDATFVLKVDPKQKGDNWKYNSSYFIPDKNKPLIKVVKDKNTALSKLGKANQKDSLLGKIFDIIKDNCIDTEANIINKLNLLVTDIQDMGSMQLSGESRGLIISGANKLLKDASFGELSNNNPIIKSILTRLTNIADSKKLYEFIFEDNDMAATSTITIDPSKKDIINGILKSNNLNGFVNNTRSFKSERLKYRLLLFSFLIGKGDSNGSIVDHLKDSQPNINAIATLYNGGYSKNGIYTPSQESYSTKMQAFISNQLYNTLLSKLDVTKEELVSQRYKYLRESAISITRQLYKDTMANSETVKRNALAGGNKSSKNVSSIINTIISETKNLEDNIRKIDTATDKNVSYIEIQANIIHQSLNALISIAKKFMSIGDIFVSGLNKSNYDIIYMLDFFNETLGEIINKRCSLINRSFNESEQNFYKNLQIHMRNPLADVGRFTGKNSSEADVLKFFDDNIFPQYRTHLLNLFTYLYHLNNLLTGNFTNVDLDVLNKEEGFGNLIQNIVAVMSKNTERFDALKSEINNREVASQMSDEEVALLDQFIQEDKFDLTLPIKISEQKMGYLNPFVTGEDASYKDIMSAEASALLSIANLYKRLIKNDIIRYNNLEIINNEKDGISTTIQDFNVQISSNSIPIFMDGQEHPIVQNLGGNKPVISMTIVTNDLFLIDNLMAALHEMDITLRTRSILRSPNPLAPGFGSIGAESSKNSLVYNLTRKNVNARIKELTAGGSGKLVEQGYTEAPVLITNNVANMMGVYGVVLSSATIDSIPNFPNGFQIGLTLYGVDINQQDRETPKKRKIFGDPALIASDCCRIPVSAYDILRITAPGRFNISNVQSEVNKHTSMLIVANFIRFMFKVNSPYIKALVGNSKQPLFNMPFDKSKEDIQRRILVLSHHMINMYASEIVFPILKEIRQTTINNLDYTNEIIKRNINSMISDLKSVLSAETPQIEHTLIQKGPGFFDGFESGPTITKSVLSLINLKRNPNPSLFFTTILNKVIIYKKLEGDISTYMHMKLLKTMDVLFNTKSFGSTVDDSEMIDLKNDKELNFESDFKNSDLENITEISNADFNWLTDLDLVKSVMEVVCNLFSIGDKKSDTSAELLKLIGLSQRSIMDITADMFYAGSIQTIRELDKNGMLHACFVHKDENKAKLESFGDITALEKILYPTINDPIIKQLRDAILANDISKVSMEKLSKEDMSYYYIAMLMTSPTIKNKSLKTKSKKMKYAINNLLVGDFANNAIKDLYGIKAVGEKIYFDGIKSDEIEKYKAIVYGNIDALINIGDYISDILRYEVSNENKDPKKDPKKQPPKYVATNLYLWRKGINRKLHAFEDNYKDSSSPIEFKYLIQSEIANTPLDLPNVSTLVNDIFNTADNRERYKKLASSYLKEEDDNTEENKSTQENANENITRTQMSLITKFSSISDKSSYVTLYRLIDAIAKFMLFPILQKVDEENKKVNSANSLSLPNTVSFFEKLIKEKSGIMTNEALNESSYNFTLGGNELSPRLIRLMYLMLPLNATTTYDVYSAYPDRPLPVFGFNSSTQIVDKSIAAMQLYTTPDFFILRNPADIQSVLINMIQKMDAGHQMIKQQMAIENLSKNSNAIYREQLKQISDVAARNLLDKQVDSFGGDVSFLSSISFGCMDTITLGDETEKRFEDNTKNSKEWLALIAEVDDDDIVSDTYSVYKELLSDNTSAGVMRAFSKYMGLDEEYKKVLNREFDLQNKLLTRQREKRDSDNNNDQLKALENARIKLASRSLNDDASLSSSEIDLVKSIINPSSGAYQVSSIPIMKDKFYRLLVNNNRLQMTSTIARSFPTFKFYIIEEDAKELLFFNDFYDYAAVKQIRINKSRKDASETAYIELSNMYGKLSNIIAGRGLKNENPFYIRPNEEENISSLYLKKGALIQVRMGYNANLGVENIVFSGRIQELQGTSSIIIVAQSHGVELTREIGTGAGEDFGGFLNRLTGLGFNAHESSSNLALIGAILDQAKVPLRGLGTLSPNLGMQRLNNVVYEDSQGLNNETVINVSWVEEALNVVTKKVLAHSLIGADPALIDSRLTNIFVSNESNNGWTSLFGRSRWMLLNETIWDALQDFNLQLANTHCTVRTMDEDNTLVIASEDDVYQRSMEDYISISTISPIIHKLHSGANDVEIGAGIIKAILNKEKSASNDTPLTDMITDMIGGTLQNIITQFDPNADIESETRNILSIISTDYGAILKALNQYKKNTSEERKETLAKINKANSSGDGLSVEDTQLLINNSSVKKTTNGVVEVDKISRAAFVLANATEKICQNLKQLAIAGEKSFRPVSEVHLKQARKDIIKNDIRIVDGYNRVELAYTDEDMLGSLVTLTGMGDLASTLGFVNTISLDNIGKVSTRSTAVATASPHIDFDKVNTYATFQKNAAIRGTILKDNPTIISNAILSNLIRDYYEGEIIILMDPTIEPLDIIMIYDDVNDYWGMIQVKEVTHSLSPETGAVTVIVPDMYVKIKMDTHAKDGWGGRALTRIATDLVFPLITMVIGGGALRWTGAIGKKLLGNKLKGFMNKSGSKAAAKILSDDAEDLANGIKDLEDVTADKIEDSIKKLVKSGVKASDGGEDIAGSEILKEFGKEVVDATGKKKVQVSGSDILGDMFDNITEHATSSGADTQISKGIKEAALKMKGGDLKSFSDGLLKFKENLKNYTYEIEVNKVKQTKNLTDAEMVEALDKFTEGISRFSGSTVNGPKAEVTQNIFHTLQKNNMLDNFGVFSFKRFGFNTTMIKGVGNSLNFMHPIAQIKALVGLGLSRRVGQFILPDFTFASVGLGEYINQNPITVMGLIHKGEPFIANLDGMRRGEVKIVSSDFISLKVGQMFNPLEAMMGDVESALYDIKSAQKDLSNLL